MTPRVELIIIGNEILSGHTLDTNSQWLAAQLQKMGLSISRIVVIRDDPLVIGDSIIQSSSRGTVLLITSGGLGPTFDDLTAKGLARAQGGELLLNETALQMVIQRYQTLHAEGLVDSPQITPAREKMAWLPPTAEPLQNNIGSAPGIYQQLKHTHIYCLPGVPNELQNMFLNEVAPRVTKLSTLIVIEKVIQVPVLDESILAPIIDSIRAKQDEVYLKSLPRPYQTREPLKIAITVIAQTDGEATKRLEEVTHQLFEAVKSIKQVE